MVDGQRVIISQFGDDPMQAVADHATLEPMSAPDPATLAAHDVLVEIRSASVGWVDLLMTSGQYQHAPKPPYTPGLEYAGVVAWAGADVTHVHAGDRVMVDGFLAGPRSHGVSVSALFGGMAITLFEVSRSRSRTPLRRRESGIGNQREIA